MLVDTSVWIDHFRFSDPDLASFLDQGRVVTHPFVIGEIACGNLRRRDVILSLLAHLPQAPLVEYHEALAVVTHHRLWGRGLGWVDVHLLASARLAGLALWTRDRKLSSSAADLGLAP